MDPALAFDPKVAAAKIGVSLPTLRRLLQRREIAFSRVGRRVVIRACDLEQFLAANRVSASLPTPREAPCGDPADSGTGVNRG